jgi:hypothetical protein
MNIDPIHALQNEQLIENKILIALRQVGTCFEYWIRSQPPVKPAGQNPRWMSAATRLIGSLASPG